MPILVNKEHQVYYEFSISTSNMLFSRASFEKTMEYETVDGSLLQYEYLGIRYPL
ncbi:MAG: hypothetical protein RR493_06665 [Erysipelotrichaceae bacterium]